LFRAFGVCAAAPADATAQQNAAAMGVNRPIG
jgi:hypothetical protein